MNSKYRKLSILGICIAFFLLFAYITYLTPLAGDDWGYALNGLKGNPFVTAYEFYFSWSGRFFSELWGFLVAPNKWLWNILNPALFTGIIFIIYKFIRPKRNPVAVLLLTIFLVLSVKDNVRMETYTWIMGTTYIVPLFLFLLYMYLLKLIIFDDNKNMFVYIGCCLINLYIPLCMENIAAGLMLANVLILIYLWFTNKKYIKRYSLFLILSIIGFIVLRMSPGSTYRLQNDNSAWLAMNIFEQIGSNWNNFLTYTFLNNKYLICFLSLVLMIFTYVNRYKYGKRKNLPYLFMFIFFLGFVQSIASMVYSKVPLSFLQYLFDLNITGTAFVVTILFIAYIIAMIWVVCTMLDDYKKWTCLFIIFVGGTCNIAMLLSPIFGPRSCVYTIFLFITLTAFIYEEMMQDSNANRITAVILILLCLVWTKSYISKYRLVHSIQKERLAQIEYYKDHPEVKTAYIVRMPIMSIHSADIEEGDTYHQQVFKEYFELDPDLELIFYWKEQY